MNKQDCEEVLELGQLPSVHVGPMKVVMSQLQPRAVPPPSASQLYPMDFRITFQQRYQDQRN